MFFRTLYSAGEDYDETTQSVTFEPGQSLVSVQVMITDDTIYEGMQEFTVMLTSSDSAVTITQSDATAQIIDNDGTVGLC